MVQILEDPTSCQKFHLTKVNSLLFHILVNYCVMGYYFVHFIFIGNSLFDEQDKDKDVPLNPDQPVSNFVNINMC